MRLSHQILISLCILGCLFSCDSKQTRFVQISSEHSGITFQNTITETDSIHYFNHYYIYIGAGVGVGDFNRDGWQDLFFSGNMVPSHLYLNLGNFNFKDITEDSGIFTRSWITGVSVVDINQDGWDDIYLSVAGYVDVQYRRNLLYINQGLNDMGQPQFEEQAERYGLNDSGHSTQAAFIDYDQDGDLDMYLATHAMENYMKLSKLYTYTHGEGPSTDRLYENTGTDSLGHPFFKDISSQAGILQEGYALGVCVSDLNRDGWPDIYVANDFMGNDLMYINQQDGTFINQLAKATFQTSQNGMGVDISDINHDGWQDILVLDMLPQDQLRQKTMTAEMNYDFYLRALNAGFSPQFIRNTLQLNQGIGPDHILKFSEIGRLSGVYQTDWSWAPLIADYDGDGHRDIYITNGFRRDVTNHDFKLYHNELLRYEQQTGTPPDEKIIQSLHQLDSVNLPNVMYQQTRSLGFTKVTNEWGLDVPSMSNGAIYADLDNDNDLDLVVNNINAPAFVFKNTSERLEIHHFLALELEGPSVNRKAIGAHIQVITPSGKRLFQELYPVRGYASSVTHRIHMGLGRDSLAEKVIIIWPGGKESILTDVKTDTLHRISFPPDQDQITNVPYIYQKSPIDFEDLTDSLGINFTHRENQHSDFRLEPLLPHLYDHFGPGIAVGDMNGDGLEDFFVGGARGQPGKLFFQNEQGTFDSDTLALSGFFEDMGSILLDVDQDGDRDLYVVSGGSSVKYFHQGHYQDRLYLNDGTGYFTLAEDALPNMQTSGSCVVASDYDLDGDLDLFVGGRIVPGKFPLSPRSYLLENQGGTFKDVTPSVAPDLMYPGLITSALWTDLDNDRDPDLIVAGEWTSLMMFINESGKLTNITQQAGLESYRGWWFSLTGLDYDADGDTDYLAGNLGHNHIYQSDPGAPVKVYANDFNKDGSLDALMTRQNEGKEYLIAPRDVMIQQMQVMKRIYPRYEQYAKADISEVLTYFDTDSMITLEASHFSSSLIENLGNSRFRLHALPEEMQISPITGWQVRLTSLTGLHQILATGNFYHTEVIGGRYDAGLGHTAFIDTLGNITYMPSAASGFWVPGDTRALAALERNDDVLYINSRNDQTLSIIARRDTIRMKIPLKEHEVYAYLIFPDGRRQKIEKYLGKGYLSQDSEVLSLPTGNAKVKICTWKGKCREIPLSVY